MYIFGHISAEKKTHHPHLLQKEEFHYSGHLIGYDQDRQTYDTTFDSIDPITIIAVVIVRQLVDRIDSQLVTSVLFFL